MSRVVIGLGSNIGDRLRQMRSAVEHLINPPSAILTDVKVSAIYESPAMLKSGAPKDWDQPFYNAAISGETDIPPEDLLMLLKSVEERIGREYRGQWSPREIDLDILAYGDRLIESSSLTIPHAELLRRDFALIPFSEVAGDWKWPFNDLHVGKSAAELVHDLGMIASGNLVRTRHHLHVHP